MVDNRIVEADQTAAQDNIADLNKDRQTDLKIIDEITMFEQNSKQAAANRVNLLCHVEPDPWMEQRSNVIA